MAIVVGGLCGSGAEPDRGPGGPWLQGAGSGVEPLRGLSTVALFAT